MKDLDRITYTDTITVDNQPVERKWNISWSKVYGPGTQSTSDTFFALYQMWAESGFNSPWIHFGSISAILNRRGVSTSKRDYDRVTRDLNALANIYIEAKNAFYDTEKRKYVDASFHLFDTIVLEKDTEGNPDPTSRGYIKAHAVLHAAVLKNTFLLAIDEKIFFGLPPIQQRLYLYLRKMLTLQRFHVRNLLGLANQIPLHTKSHKRIKQMIKEAVQAILDAGLIPNFASFRIYKSTSGAELIRFETAAAQQLSLFLEQQGQQKEEDEKDSNFGLITDLCKDVHSTPFYQKVASLMSTDDICRAISETKEFAKDVQRGGASCNIPKVFTSRIISLATQRKIDLHA